MAPRRAPAREDAGEPESEEVKPPVASDDEPPVAENAEPTLVQKVLPEEIQDALRRDLPPAPVLNPTHAELLAEACYVFGVNPDPRVKPRELAAHRFDPGEPNGTPPIPASVIFVTGGGVKIRYPIDDQTEERLRVIYNCYREDPKTHTRVALPLPQTLTLPHEQVDGIVRSAEHQYRTGYLHEGGKEEAARRATHKELRDAGRLR